MLCETHYTPEAVADCRAALDRRTDAYRRVASAASGDPAAVEAFEPLYFADLVLVLDGHFTHRSRGKEGKDGNALNEVRMLSASLTRNGGSLAADKSIRYQPERSVLGTEVGAPIRVTARGFEALAAAFLTEIGAKYAP